MHQHACHDWDGLVIRPGDPEMEACSCRPISASHEALSLLPCKVHCVECESGGHHWMPDCDEDNGQPFMKCKHCEARRDYTDADAD